MFNDHLIPRQMKTLWDLDTTEDLLSIPEERARRQREAKLGDAADGDQQQGSPINKMQCPDCDKTIYYDDAKPQMCPYCGVKLTWD